MHGPGLVIGGSCVIGEGMIGAPDTPIPVKLSPSANIAAGATDLTTNLLTLPSGKTFQAGLRSDDTNPLPSIDLGANTFTELEVSIYFPTVTNKTYEFEIYAVDDPLDVYTQIPQVTVAAAGAYDRRKSSFFFQ